MATQTFLNDLAHAIAEANKGKTTYCARVTRGEFKGLYIGQKFKLVKTKRYALGAFKDDLETFRYTFNPNLLSLEDLEIVLKKKGSN